MRMRRSWGRLEHRARCTSMGYLALVGLILISGWLELSIHALRALFILFIFCAVSILLSI